MKYHIQIWETEDHRDQGLAFEFYETPDDKESCIERAKHMYWHQDFAAVEVISEEGGEAVYHISNDVPEGERIAEVTCNSCGFKFEIDVAREMKSPWGIACPNCAAEWKGD
jgi:hypothetical protein